MILTIILLVIASVANVLMDLSSESVLKGYWDKNISWKNKYKLGKKENGPAFPGSTTIFVWITDGWHLMQMIFHTSWQLAIAIQIDRWFIAFVTIKVIFSICFEIIYSRLKNRR